MRRWAQIPLLLLLAAAPLLVRPAPARAAPPQQQTSCYDVSLTQSTQTTFTLHAGDSVYAWTEFGQIGIIAIDGTPVSNPSPLPIGPINVRQLVGPAVFTLQNLGTETDTFHTSCVSTAPTNTPTSAPASDPAYCTRPAGDGWRVLFAQQNYAFQIAPTPNDITGVLVHDFTNEPFPYDLYISATDNPPYPAFKGIGLGPSASFPQAFSFTGIQDGRNATYETNTAGTNWRTLYALFWADGNPANGGGAPSSASVCVYGRFGTPTATSTATPNPSCITIATHFDLAKYVELPPGHYQVVAQFATVFPAQLPGSSQILFTLNLDTLHLDALANGQPLTGSYDFGFITTAAQFANLRIDTFDPNTYATIPVTLSFCPVIDNTPLPTLTSVPTATPYTDGCRHVGSVADDGGYTISEAVLHPYRGLAARLGLANGQVRKTVRNIDTGATSTTTYNAGDRIFIDAGTFEEVHLSSSGLFSIDFCPLPTPTSGPTMTPSVGCPTVLIGGGQTQQVTAASTVALWTIQRSADEFSSLRLVAANGVPYATAIPLPFYIIGAPSNPAGFYAPAGTYTVSNPNTIGVYMRKCAVAGFTPTATVTATATTTETPTPTETATATQTPAPLPTGALPTPTGFPGEIGTICPVGPTAPPANLGTLPDLAIPIPTLRTLPTITATVQISAEIVTGPIATLQAGISTPAAAVQTAVAGYSWSSGEQVAGGWQLRLQPALDWLAVLNPNNPAYTVEGGPLWALAPILIPLLPIVIATMTVAFIRLFIWFLGWLLKLIDLLLKIVELIPGE